MVSISYTRSKYSSTKLLAAVKISKGGPFWKIGQTNTYLDLLGLSRFHGVSSMRFFLNQNPTLNMV